MDMLLKRLQGRLLVQGKPDQRDNIGPETPATFSLNLGRFQRGVGIPQPVDAPEVRRTFNHLGQTLDLVVLQALTVRAAVKDLQGGNLVLVLLDELLEGMHQTPWPYPAHRRRNRPR